MRPLLLLWLLPQRSHFSTCELAIVHNCRSCTTDHQKVVRCHQILAASVNLHASSHVNTTVCKHETGLAVAVDAVRGTLSELCADGKDAATQALLLQPVVSTLHTVAMLQYKKSSCNPNSQFSIHNLRQIGAEAAVLAAEVRFMLQRSCPADKQVALAIYDFQALAGKQASCSLRVLQAAAPSPAHMSHHKRVYDAGGDTCAVLELLLDDAQRFAVPNNEDFPNLWQILYKAAVQLPNSSEFCSLAARSVWAASAEEFMDIIFTFEVMHTPAVIQQLRLTAACAMVIIAYADASERGFLLRLAAAQNACDGRFPESQKSQLLAPFDSMAAPASFIAWLSQQPMSETVQQCQDALQQSPIKLTQHLLSG